MTEQVRTPLTLIAGWHGSGKSRLVERISRGDLTGPCAAIVPSATHFPGVRIVLKTEEEVIEQSAGCRSCAVRFDLIRNIRHLLLRKVRPNRIVVELTGWADASTAAQTILGDPHLARSVELDALVTVVDANALLVRPLPASHCGRRTKPASSWRLPMWWFLTDWSFSPLRPDCLPSR